MEDYVHILDYLPEGRPGAPGHERGPTLLGVGEEKFTLFELQPRKGASFTIGDRCYVGKDVEKRDVVQKIKGRLNYDQVTPAAHAELEFVIEDIITANPERFLQFYNDAQGVNLKFHALQLLPGVGKKAVETIVQQRRQRFTTFEDLAERTGLKNPKRMLVDRIIQELRDSDEQYHIFTRPQREEQPRRPRGRGPRRD